MLRYLAVGGFFVSSAVTSAAALCAPTLAGCAMFPANNIWNTPVDTLPVDANSTAYINTIGASGTLHPDFGSGLWDGGPIGIPYVTVPGTQPKVPVTFDYDDESDPGPYPIPPDAPIEGGPASSGDRHILVVDRDNCLLYETWSTYPATGGGWTAGSGAKFDLNSNALRPDGWTSADAAGLPVLHGLVRYDEVAAGEILHALRFTVPQTRRAYVWPARHFASSRTGMQYPPMGQRFRLKASYDISGFSPSIQVILRALKKYGMMLADNGSAWYLSGAPDERWDNDLLRELRNVPGSAFEAVDVSGLMVNADSGAVNSLAVPGAPGIGTAVPGKGSATVNFAPPASNGGASIDSYRVTCNPGNHTATGTSSPIVLGGLTDGTSYDCTAAAHNAVGWGPASASVNVTPNPASRAFVSSLSGNDANASVNCPRAAPCRWLNSALGVVSPGAEVVVLDSGGYGAATLTQSATITGAPGVRAVIDVLSGDGIVIATPGIEVALRNLAIIGTGGANGVRMTAGASLAVERSLVSGFSAAGISVSGLSRVSIVDSMVRDNAVGVQLVDGPRALLTRTQLLGNASRGILAQGSTAGTQTRASLNRSVVAGAGTAWGVAALSLTADASAEVSVSHSSITGCALGATASSSSGGPAGLTLNRSKISANTVGLHQSGAGAVLRSTGNNSLNDNGVNLSGDLTALSPR